MNVIEVQRLTYRYGRVTALQDVDFAVSQGGLYALLGPNGSGKTTLLQCLMGLRRPQSGRVTVLGADVRALTPRLRGRIGYVAEGQPLPSRMRLRDVEAYLAPLYDGRWDTALADSLRDRFDLDPSRKLQAFSRGEQMKAALLCALAPRPELLVMDEPFTGMDALVKDELIGGLLDSAGTEGWTVLLCSHDIGELELLADRVGFLQNGRLALSDSMDALRDRFVHVEVTLAGDAAGARAPVSRDWLSVEHAGHRLTFVLRDATSPADELAAAHLDGVLHVVTRGATLREIFVGLARHTAIQQAPTAAREMVA